MTELADVKKSLAGLYQHELDLRRDWIEQQSLTREKVDQLKSEIDNIEGNSVEAKQLEGIESELRSVNTSIEKLEKQLEILNNKRKELQSKRQSTQSVIESRIASVQSKIEDLSEGVLEPRELDTFSREAELYEDYHRLNKKEFSALTDGAVIWKDVCMIVSDLERNLATQTQQTNPQTLIKQPPDEQTILNLLNDAKLQLQKHLDLSNQSNWKLLAVAISHEIAAVDQGISLVSKHLMTASLSDLRHTTS
jgi:DNA repair exonuclease SbcCD ATPase subunit